MHYSHLTSLIRYATTLLFYAFHCLMTIFSLSYYLELSVFIQVENQYFNHQFRTIILGTLTYTNLMIQNLHQTSRFISYIKEYRKWSLKKILRTLTRNLLFNMHTICCFVVRTNPRVRLSKPNIFVSSECTISVCPYESYTFLLKALSSLKMNG